jgi:hypothetical protein
MAARAADRSSLCHDERMRQAPKQTLAPGLNPNVASRASCEFRTIRVAGGCCLRRSPRGIFASTYVAAAAALRLDTHNMPTAIAVMTPMYATTCIPAG